MQGVPQRATEAAEFIRPPQRQKSILQLCSSRLREPRTPELHIVAAQCQLVGRAVKVVHIVESERLTSHLRLVCRQLARRAQEVLVLGDAARRTTEVKGIVRMAGAGDR